MIRLSLPTESYWLELPSGVRAKVKPLDMVVYNAALGVARRTVPSEADEPDADLRQSIHRAAFATQLARYGIEEWEGVQNPSGEGHADVTPENVALLMRIPAIGSSFLNQYVSSVVTVVAEGNA